MVLLGGLLTPRLLTGQIPDSVRRQVDSVFTDYDRTNAPGCALAIYRDGAIAYARGYGMANLELGVALSPRTVFDIGSTSKQFAAFAVGMLAREGKLSLDDPVRKHIPEMGAYADRMTVRNLVQHTSGLRDYLTLMWLAGYRFDDVTDDQDALKLIVRQKAANFPADSEWLYSNTGYFLLSQIVKRVSGKTLRAFAEERIFQPLGMRVTHFHDDHTMIVADRATGYRPREGGGFQIDMSNFEQTGDGAVYTTLEELLIWDRNWYSGTVGGAQLIADQQVTGKLSNGVDHHYASGLFLEEYRGLPTVRHGGAWAGYRAELLRFPKERTSIACLCNRGDADPSNRANQVADILFAGKLAPRRAPAVAGNGAPASPISAELLAALQGAWQNRATGDVRVFVTRENKLYPLGGNTALTQTAPDRLSYGAATVRYTAGTPASFTLERQSRPPEVYHKVASISSDSAARRMYAGTWYSEELDAFWRLVPTGEGLRIDIRDRPSGVVRQVGADLFTDGQRHLAFIRSGGKITGFTVAAGRVRGIGFSRSGL